MKQKVVLFKQEEQKDSANEKKQIDEIQLVLKKLEDNGDIHYTKDIEMDYFMAYNMIYQLYSNEKRMKTNFLHRYQDISKSNTISQRVKNVYWVPYLITIFVTMSLQAPTKCMYRIPSNKCPIRNL
jgi:hypothetical protein